MTGPHDMWRARDLNSADMFETSFDGAFGVR